MNASTHGASANAGSHFGTARENVSDALNRGKEGLSNAASTLANNASTDMESLRKDLNSLKDTVSQFISQAGEVSSSVANQVSGAASDLAERGANVASAAKDQAKPRPSHRSLSRWAVATHSARWQRPSWSGLSSAWSAGARAAPDVL